MKLRSREFKKQFLLRGTIIAKPRYQEDSEAQIQFKHCTKNEDFH